MGFNEKPLLVKYVPSDWASVFYQKFNESPLGSTLFLFYLIYLGIAIDLSVEWPETFSNDNDVTLLFNVVKPETFIDDTNETLFLNVVKPDSFNDDSNVVWFNIVKPDSFNENSNIV